MASAGEWLEALLLADLILAPVAAVVGASLAGPSRRSRIKWGCFCLIMPFVVLFLFHRRARGRTAEGEPRFTPSNAKPAAPGRPRPRPVPSPTQEDLRDVPEPVSACPDCGFLGIRMPGIQDGAWAGGGQIMFQVCPRCHYRGHPIVFGAREDYAEFVRELAAAPRADGAP